MSGRLFNDDKMKISSIEQAVALKKELEQRLSFGNQVDGTEYKVEIDTRNVRGFEFALEVVPAGKNTGNAFFYAAECVDFTREHSMSMFIYTDMKCCSSKIKVRIF